MDLVEVERVRIARERSDLNLAPGEVVIGGGTWVYSEPQPGTTGIVDLAGLGWEPIVARPDGGVDVAATCTLAELRDGADALGSAAALAASRSKRSSDPGRSTASPPSAATSASPCRPAR